MTELQKLAGQAASTLSSLAPREHITGNSISAARYLELSIQIRNLCKSPEIQSAREVTSVTTVGCLATDFPRKHGNCFSVLCFNRKEYRIVNFNYENLEEAVKRGVAWPIQILEVTPTVAVIHDHRIPDDWYDEQWCEICCPKDYLPYPQLLTHQRQILSGVREELPGSICIRHHMAPKL